jgi:hypothetical protein
MSLLEAKINGQAYSLKPDGTNFRWYREDGTPTGIVKSTEREARRAFMFGGINEQARTDGPFPMRYFRC